jgi:hypothetical protein
MKTVDLTIFLDSWYAHAPAGGMRFWYFGGQFKLVYKEYVKFGEYIDPHTKQVFFSDQGFILEMITKAMNTLKEPCNIRLHLPETGFIYDIIKNEIYKYWKANNWRYKSGNSPANEWIEFDRVLCEKGHTIEVIE